MLKKIFEDIYYYLDEELAKRADEVLDIKDYSKISISHLDYLDVIKRKGKPTLGEIAEELNFTKPSVTIMINKLIKQDFVRKVQSEDDKRVYYVELTNLGEELIEIQLNVYLDFANKLEQILDDDEVERLEGLLSKGLRVIRG